MGALTGKSALITGASGGIGFAIAQTFSREGAQVVITGRRESTLTEAVERLGSGALGVTGDVAEAAHHRRLAQEIAARFGRLDIYVANAGINTVGETPEVSEADYDNQFAANTRGIFFGVQSIAPIMRDGGAILLTGSLASEKVLEGHAVYAGTKAAIGAFARSWAIELSGRGIRVNVLSPGPTDTGIVGKMGMPPEQVDEFAAGMAAAIPLGRFADPDEIARAALFLASEASSFVTGVNLRVDGGMALL